jgi:hypothetical protein
MEMINSADSRIPVLRIAGVPHSSHPSFVIIVVWAKNSALHVAVSECFVRKSWGRESDVNRAKQ